MAAMATEPVTFPKGLATVRAGDRRLLLFENKVLDLSWCWLCRAGRHLEGVWSAAVGIRFSRSSTPAETKVQPEADAANNTQNTHDTASIHGNRNEATHNKCQRKEL